MKPPSPPRLMTKILSELFSPKVKVSIFTRPDSVTSEMFELDLGQGRLLDRTPSGPDSFVL